MRPILEHIEFQNSLSWHVTILREPLYYAWHYHTLHELLIAGAGEGVFYIDGTYGRYRAPDVFLTGPKVPHAFMSDSGGIPQHITIAHFNEAAIFPDAVRRCEARALDSLLGMPRPAFRFSEEIARRILHCCSFEEDGCGFESWLRLLGILHSLSCDRGKTDLTGDMEGWSRQDTPLPSPFVRLCRYIRTHLDSCICLTDAARIAGISVPTLCRMVKRCAGCTFVELVNRIRVRRACKLLLATEFSVTKICYSAGFNSISSFNRWFRRFQRMSPHEFRQLPRHACLHLPVDRPMDSPASHFT